jgi:hypothetical protein
VHCEGSRNENPAITGDFRVLGPLSQLGKKNRELQNHLILGFHMMLFFILFSAVVLHLRFGLRRAILSKRQQKASGQNDFGLNYFA